MYFQSMYERLQTSPKIQNQKFDENTKAALSNNLNQNIDAVLKKYLKEYSIDLYKNLSSQKNEASKPLWVH